MIVWMLEKRHTEFCSVLLTPELFGTQEIALGFALEYMQVLLPKSTPFADALDYMDLLAQYKVVTFPTFSTECVREATFYLRETVVIGGHAAWLAHNAHRRLPTHAGKALLRP